MSDYMFMLESHLRPEQYQALLQVQAAAEHANLNVFLSGGALRDMLGGFPIRDVDFTVEGNPAPIVKHLVKKHGAKVVHENALRKSWTLQFPSGVVSEIGMAHEAHYARPASKPTVKPATIHEDLRGRDFTINAIALSLNRSSRGLLIDPTNGQGDLMHREIRTTGNYSLYDDPVRIIRMLRLKIRMGFEISERTRLQYENVREARLEQKITPAQLYRELRAMADEPNPGLLIETLDQEKLLTLFSPAFTGAKINLAGFAKLLKLRQMVPFGIEFKTNNLGLFLHVLTEKFSPKERNALIKDLGIPKADQDQWLKLDQRAKKLETQLKSAKLNKASLVYKLLLEAAGDEILYLLYHSEQRLVQDRLKKHLTQYLPGVLEINDKEVAAWSKFEPGSPKFAKAREDYILGRLDGRIRKPAPEPAPEPPPAPAGRGALRQPHAARAVR
jgi:tRNA nucleotidyltransferase/poly(A) polymerase